MPKALLREFKDPLTLTALFVVCILYIVAGFFFPIISDEFHEAVEVYSLFDKVPYRDYFYYKNVLGYYLKYPALFIFKDWFSSILLSRVFLGLAWSFSLFLFLRKIAGNFSKKSLVLSFLGGALLTNNLLHAASYRVDLLTALFGIFSLISLRNQNYLKAGILASLSFFISQKGIWFCMAGFLSLALIKEYRKDILPYLRGGILIGILYVGVFGALSSPRDVLYGIFFKDIGMASSAGYQIRHFWSQSFFENWPFWLISGAGLTLIFFDKESQFLKRQKLTVLYSVIFLLFFGLNPQSWPYNFVFITPFLCFYSLYFWEILFQRNPDQKLLICLFILIIGTPLFNLKTNHRLTNNHQKVLVENLEKVLGEDDTYIAGFNLLPKNKQVHPFFNWLSAIERTKAFSLSTDEINKLKDEWEERPAKALVHNYRTRSLPPFTQEYFKNNYSPFWGNLYLRSIKFRPDKKKYRIPFPGTYIYLPKPRESKSNSVIKIKLSSKEEKFIKLGESINLAMGEVSITADQRGKLMYFPGKIELSLLHKNETNLNFTYD